MRVIRFDSVDSTQQRARALLSEGEGADRPIIVAAAEQTAGQGRLGRSWRSPRGGLYFTCVQRLDDQSRVEAASLSIGFALCESLEVLGGLPTGTLEVKWPNDVHLAGRKLAGVLCEIVAHSGRRFLLAGVGVNVERAPELEGGEAGAYRGFAAPAACLREAATLPCGALALLEPVAEAIAARLQQHLRQGLDEATRAGLEARLRGRGCRLELTVPPGGEVSGVLMGLTPAGLLQIRAEEGEIIACGGAEIARIHDNRLP